MLEPQAISELADKKVVHIAAGSEHSAALTGIFYSSLLLYLTCYLEEGEIWVWGHGQRGQLSGLTDLKDSYTPFRLPGITFVNPKTRQPGAERTETEEPQRFC